MTQRLRGLPAILGSVLIGLLCFGFVLGATVGRESLYKYLNVFAEVYTLVKGNYVDPVDENSLLDGAYHGMVGGLDPFSGFVGKDEFQAMQKDPLGGPADTGIEVLKGPGGAVVVAVRPGSEADKAGLKNGDQIWAMDGTPSRQLCLAQMRRAQRGGDGSVVRLLLYHPRSQKREELKLHRTVAVGPAFESRVADGKIGYLRIFDLARSDRDSLKTALAGLKQKGATRLLLDIRNCPSGTIDDAVRVAGLFVPPGAVTFVQERGGNRVAKASTAQAVWSLPVSVLENAGSAGGVEILASALRARVKAQLLGEASYGLGSTQDLVPLPSGDGLVLSAAKLVSPDGQSWNKSGLKPDKEIVSSADERAEIEPDLQLQKALDSLKPAPAAAPAAKAA
jgi:carboxyl-terminal processing protease